MTVFFTTPSPQVKRQCEGVKSVTQKAMDPSKSNYPFFMHLPSMEDLSPEELVWLEAAMPAVGEFVLEAARLGGGGKNAVSSAPVMQPDEVFSALLNPTFTSHATPTLVNGFPCRQKISTTTGEIQVILHVEPTQTSITHAKSFNEPPREVSEGPAQDSVEMSATSRMCFICRRTESDLLSRSGTGLKKCSACRSDVLRYCSAECQKRDWKRHKPACRKAAEAAASSL